MSQDLQLPDDIYLTTGLTAGGSTNVYESLKRDKAVTDLKYKGLHQIPTDVIKNDKPNILLLDGNHFLTIPEELFWVDSLIFLSLASQISSKRASVSQRPALEEIPEGKKQYI